MRKAINGEIHRRYRLFKEAGARDANEYEEMRLAGRDLEPVPILLVIIDEYLELFHHHQEWIQLVIHIGQEGRGCNVFFTLGGQRLDLSSLSKAKSNIAFRVALRAETAEDSRDVIGNDAALHLPSKENGYALLKVGPRDLEPFRCFYLSAPFVLPKKVDQRQPDHRCELLSAASADVGVPAAERGRHCGPCGCRRARGTRRIPVPLRRLPKEEAARRHSRFAGGAPCPTTAPNLASPTGNQRAGGRAGGVLARQTLACRLRAEPGPDLPARDRRYPRGSHPVGGGDRRRDGQRHGRGHRAARQEHHADDVDDVGRTDVPPGAGDVLLHRGGALSRRGPSRTWPVSSA